MGTETRNPRNVYVGIRFTEKESVQLHSQMDMAHYKSVSRYIREKVLKSRSTVMPSPELTGREVRDRLNVVSTEIAKVGVDYRSLVGEFRRLSESGSSRINPGTANIYLGKLNAMTRKVSESMDRLLDLFLRIEKETESRGGNPAITYNTTVKMLQKIEIIGSLVADAELKTGRDDSQYIVFRVGVYENFGEERRSTYYDVTYPNSGIFKYLKKGKQVYVSGRLSLSIYQKEDKSYLNARISAKDIELCGTKEA